MHVFETTRRRTAVAAVAVVAVAIMSGCGSDRIGGGTAAEVGDTRVTRAAVVDAVDRALATGKTQLTRQQLTEQHLTTQLRLSLYKQEAAKLNVTPTDEERSAVRTAFEQQAIENGGLENAAAASGIAKEDIPVFVDLITYQTALAKRLIKDRPVTDADLDTFRQSNPQMPAFVETAHAAHILVNDEATANKVLAEVKAGGDFAALAAKYSTDTSSKDKGGDLGSVPKGSFVPAFDAALFAAKTGDILGPVKTEFGYHIIKAIEVLSAADVKERVRGQVGVTIGGNLLKDELSKGPAVTVNPRFGRWDSNALTVISGETGADDPSKPSPSPTGLVDGAASGVVAPEPAASSPAP